MRLRELQRRLARLHAARRSKRSEREGAEGIVLDLRGNGGGLLDEAVLTASIFLPKGEVVVTTESRTQGDAVYDDRRRQPARRCRSSS